MATKKFGEYHVKVESGPGELDCILSLFRGGPIDMQITQIDFAKNQFKLPVQRPIQARGRFSSVMQLNEANMSFKFEGHFSLLIDGHWQGSNGSYWIFGEYSFSTRKGMARLSRSYDD